MRPKNQVDCVEMKRDIQRRIMEEFAGLTSEEQRRRTRERILSDPVFGPVWQRAMKRMDSRRLTESDPDDVHGSGWESNPPRAA